MAKQKETLFDTEAFAFSSRFLQDHAGQIISDGRTAILELIANGYDAGATHIAIAWPTERGEEFSVTDDGIGMTHEEFFRRWKTLSYNRLEELGSAVKFPPKVKGVQRTAFGRSGKGRHAPFCFADSYQVTTAKNGSQITVRVELSKKGASPFAVTQLKQSEALIPGTTISAVVDRRLLKVDDLRQLIGSKFLMDPSLQITVNDEQVELMELKGVKTEFISVGEYGNVTVHFVDSIEHARTARLRGITWWVNNRMVGDPSWDRLDDEGAYLDGRTEHAKRFSFIVEADALKEDVKADWSGFHSNKRVNEICDAVHRHVLKELHGQLASGRKERKKTALMHSRELLGELPVISKKTISRFIDEVQEKCPTLSERDLSRTVEVLAKLEQSRSGYDLLTQLSACSTHDLDTWNRLMSEWTASNAEIILSELHRRLKLIERMESLVESPLADELHDLQPLFERGLWIFGPEYESVDFRSNRGLMQVIGKFLGGADYKPPTKRPDFVVLPESSIGAYSADSYDDGGEVAGIRKVIIVELKKGGSRVKQHEADQARDYAKEITKGGRVQPNTEILAYVLGASLEEGLEKMTIGDRITIVPMIYQTILRKSHQRTFNLQQRLEAAVPTASATPDVDAVVGQMQKPLFEDAKSA